MLRSHKEYDPDENPREHSYHVLCNWHFNFWSVAKDLGIKRNFTTRGAFRFLYKGDQDNMPQIVNPGGIQDFYRNLTGGAAPAQELFLFINSMIDLLSIPDDGDEELDDITFIWWLSMARRRIRCSTRSCASWRATATGSE